MKLRTTFKTHNSHIIMSDYSIISSIRYKVNSKYVELQKS